MKTTTCVKITFKKEKRGSETFQRPPMYTTAQNLMNVENVLGKFIKTVDKNCVLDENGQEINQPIIKKKVPVLSIPLPQSVNTPIDENETLILGLKKKGKTPKQIALIMDIPVDEIKKYFE